MANDTISGVITQTVTLGSGSYAANLTIAAFETIAPTLAGSVGVVSPQAGGTLDNLGVVLGGAGTSNPDGGFISFGGAGGSAVSQSSAGLVENKGTIAGGAGGSAGQGGAAGNGVILAAGGSLVNEGSIAGGAGGAGLPILGGAGGIGVDATGVAGIVNDGAITGGAGGSNDLGGPGVNAGAALVLEDNGTLVNHGLLAGGAGGESKAYAAGGAAGVAVKAGGAVFNSGTMAGGNGGTGGLLGGSGGAGLAGAAGVQLINSGLIIGGAGLTIPRTDGQAGDGVSVAGSSYILNEGAIIGGAGGWSETFGPGVGGVGVYLGGGTLVDAGTIAGGLDVFGSLQGAQGAAVQFGTLAGLLVINAGAVLDGAVADFGTADTIELAGFSTMSESFVAGAGLVLSNGTSTQTLSFAGGLTGADLVVTAAGGNTTIARAASLSVLGGLSTESVRLGSAVDPGPLSVTNTGIIAPNAGGYASPGVLIPMGALQPTITNAGTIFGAAGNGAAGNFAVAAVSAVGAPAVFSAQSQASGGSGANGVELGKYSAGNVLINSGTISGGAGAVGAANGDAVYFGNYAATLVVDPGAVFVGYVAANIAASDVLVLAGGGTGTLAGVGSQFTGFSAISIAAGAAWTIAGDAAGLADGVAIAGFTLGDAIILDGFAASSESFVAGAGLVLSNGTSAATIGLIGRFSSASASYVTSDGTNTTILGAISAANDPTSSLITQTVTLGSGGYADSLTIGQAGTIAPLPVSAAGVVGTLAGNYLDNLGHIMGGAGANSDESGGFGGVGLILAAGGSLNNSGLLAGGSGGNGGTLGSALYPLFADHGGGGAAGASLVAGGSLNNGGTLVGGNGGSGFFGGQGGDGVDAVAGVLLINTGLIAGGTGGGGTNTAGRAGDGVSVAGSAYVLNEGVILAGTGGVGAYLGGGTLVDSGTIEGATAVQFGSVAATLVLEQGGVLQGNIVNFSSLDSIELTSFSAVSESFVTGTGLILSNGNITETLSVSGALSIADFAVTEQGSSTSIARVAAPSVINGVVSKSVTLGSTDYPGPLTVTNTGVIAPGTGGKYAHPPGVVIQDNAAYPTLTNFGTIKGSTSNIYNYAVAISSSTPADITNYGLLAGGVGMNGGTLANIHGQIVGYNGAATVFTYHGPRVGGSGAGLGRGAYLFNSGTITGGNGGGSQMGPAASGGVGVSLSSGASMTNDGVIQGGQSAYGGLMGGNGGTGLVANDSGTVVNNGQIYGGSENDGSAGSHVGGGAGVQAYGSYVRNAGTIRGGTVTGRGSDLLGGTGVALGAGKAAASLVNSGVIQGGGGVTGGAGIDLTSGDATVTNLGAVMGGAGGYGMTLGGAGGDGVTLGNHGSGDVLINAGTIAGGAGGLNGQSVAAASGAAVSFGSYAATLVVDAGAVFVGQVAANTLAADVLVLSGSDSADLALVGSQFSGFATIDIDVAGLSGTSATFGNGAVTLFNGTVGIDTLALPNFSLSATQEILVHQDGLGGTEIAIVTISNTTIGGYQHQPHFDDGDHATIESGGTVDNPTINGGTLELGLGSTLSGDISFGDGGRLIIDGDVPDNTITGFAPGDTIELAGVPYLPGDSVTVANAGTVTIFENGTTYHLNIAGATVGESFAISGDLALTAVACFCPGTRIATARGSKMVQTLRIGDVVKTVHAGLQPVKWIGTRTYAAPFCNNPRTLPIKISAGAIAAGVPRRDLYVSPGHALCIDGQLIHAGRLVNGVSITQAARAELVTYFHVELETHEVILAENCPVESFMDEDFRAQFQNAADYAARYPGGAAPAEPCLPMLRDGFELFALQRRLARRAGVMMRVDSTGPLRGSIDETGGRLRGWAQDALAAEHPVTLMIMADGAYAGQLIANSYREDLVKAGLGSGHHAFDVPCPPGRITLHRACDGAMLGAERVAA